MLKLVLLDTWIDRYSDAVISPPADYLAALSADDLRAAHALAVEAYDLASGAVLVTLRGPHLEEWLPFLLASSKAERAYSDERIRRLMKARQ